MSFSFLRRSLEAGRFAEWAKGPVRVPVMTAVATHKVCSRCGETKSMDEFYPNPKPTLKCKRRPECKACTRKAQKRHYDKVYAKPGRDRTPAGEGAGA